MHDLLLLGVAIAVEPVPLIAFILVLSTGGGARNGAAFIAAWVVSLVVIVVGVLVLTGGEPVASGSAPSRGVDIVTIAVGVALLVIAARRWRSRADRPTTTTTPSWMSRLDHLGLGGAAALGFLLQPWTLIAAAAASVAQADLSEWLAVVELVLFGLLATSTLLAMEIVTLADPERAEVQLGSLRTWLETHRSGALTVVAAVVGAYLVAKGCISLAAQP